MSVIQCPSENRIEGRDFDEPDLMPLIFLEVEKVPCGVDEVLRLLVIADKECLRV
jgi:hypothetical protein